MVLSILSGLNFSPLAKVITPNIYEASALSGINVIDEKSMEEAALVLKNTGPEAIIITGGHLEHETLDLILFGGRFYKLRTKKTPGEFMAPDVHSPPQLQPILPENQLWFTQRKGPKPLYTKLYLRLILSAKE